MASREDLEIGAPHPRTGKPIVRQDEDVLDTWASSWLWPFATLGWPDRTPDLARFYRTQFLSTARDIIYLWVARMVMAGYEFMDHLPPEERCPFDVCNIHATVLDGQGRRMSKSLGNGIDPIEMIDQYGADAVRFSLILLTREGQDVKLSPERFDQGFRFGNKIWNAARFVLMNMQGEAHGRHPGEADRLEDRWILSRLASAREDVSKALDEYRLNERGHAPVPLHLERLLRLVRGDRQAAHHRRRSDRPGGARDGWRGCCATCSACCTPSRPTSPRCCGRRCTRPWARSPTCC